MAFISGYLGLASAVSQGSATEVAGTGYSRQPISFSAPVYGVSRSLKGFTFGNPSIPQPPVGRAIYDAPTGGNLLLVLPRSSSRPVPGVAVDAAGPGEVFLVFSALASYPDGEAFSGSLAAGSVVGTCYDALDILGPSSMVSGGNLVPAQINSSLLSCGVQLSINRGVLAAHGSFVT